MKKLSKKKAERIWMLCYVHYKQSGWDENSSIEHADQDLKVFKKRWGYEK